MTVKLKTPGGVAPPVAFYQHLAVVEPSSRMLVLAGQVGQAIDGSFPDTVEAQFQQALDNILTIVKSEGGGPESIARLTCFLTSAPESFAEVGDAVQRTFPNGLPAMSWIYVAGLFAPHVKIEIEAIAAVPA